MKILLVSRGLPRFAGFCFLVLLSGLGGTPAQAAEQDAQDETVVLPEFAVSTESADRYRAGDAISAVRVRAPLIDTPSSITVLTRDMIDDLAPSRIFDATRFVAGVQDGRGMQFQDRMIMRGFESNGQRTVDNFLQPADADNIDEIVVDRIEVAKGPNAILSPSGAPGGSLNIITKTPLYKTRRTLTALVGMFDAQKVSLDLTGPFSADSALAYRFVGSLQDTRRYWANDARMRGKVLAPMLSWRLSEKTQLNVKLVAVSRGVTWARTPRISSRSSRRN
jgi:iron complex outermembrane receptor protein